MDASGELVQKLDSQSRRRYRADNVADAETILLLSE